MDVVVVGAGITASRVVEELQAKGHAGRITVIGAERHQPYDRPPLSKEVLRGEGREPTLPTDWSGVQLLLSRQVVALSTSDKQIRLDDGTTSPYDALVIATGARPRTLPVLSGAGVHVLRSRDDAAALADDIRRAGRLVVIGAGFIGSEVAASARAMGAAVTMIEILPAPLSRVLGEQVGQAIATMHGEQGVDLHCGVSVQESRGEGDDRELVLSDGQVVAAPVVLVGLGVTPDTGWLDGSGVEVDDGVVCDATGRTSVGQVWAAGDVARWWHPLYDAAIRMEHWTSAAAQGSVVAQSVLGEDRPLDEVPYFWSDQYGLKLQMLGRPAPGDDVTLLQVGPKERLVAVYGRSGVATAVFGVGAARWVMRSGPLLQERSSVDEAIALMGT
ncbi:MAG: 3-phenylpropionate/trans-cinnamate dioxygenase ferredoxin reductase component [Actinomycetota bacterium]|jgi:3-phenylpropionate/trans-cinnamate dioxygenase ferredoxin reductase subunit|nr:3-phenylpropionate/trans-cinnamate dioxygenase ferredoxin reductase component [Actinomycetota bacterium]